MCAALNLLAVWKQERRDRRRKPGVGSPDPTFREAFAHFTAQGRTVRLLAIVGLGTMAFAMSEVLLEPYGGEILAWSVASTTKLTALLAFGSLIGLIVGSHVLGNGGDPFRIARNAALVGIPALGLVILAAPLGLDAAFVSANLMLGFGAALFAHATLTATMNRAPKAQEGMALGAWGGVQATAAGAAMAIGAIIRDTMDLAAGAASGPATDTAPLVGYLTVYVVEIVLLVVTIVVIVPLLRKAPGRAAAAHETSGPGGG
jgi:BCD family chlorophyll transporter-like MFS transporter